LKHLNPAVLLIRNINGLFVNEHPEGNGKSPVQDQNRRQMATVVLRYRKFEVTECGVTI
jgi:hypothetical protein